VNYINIISLFLVVQQALKNPRQRGRLAFNPRHSLLNTPSSQLKISVITPFATLRKEVQRVFQCFARLRNPVLSLFRPFARWRKLVLSVFDLSQGCEKVSNGFFKLSQGCEKVSNASFAFSSGDASVFYASFAFSSGDATLFYWFLTFSAGGDAFLKVASASPIPKSKIENPKFTLILPHFHPLYLSLPALWNIEKTAQSPWCPGCWERSLS
jgi:hypothetical protein